jgi:3-oxoisoapionate decarboxylase
MTTTAKLGISTYAYFWQHSDLVPEPLSALDMLEDVHRLGADVFQICDYAPIEGFSDEELAGLRERAQQLEVDIELGTRGVTPEHLARYLELAKALDATMVRSMVNTADHKPTEEEAERMLREALPAYEAAGVTIALETYEQVPTSVNLGLVERIDSPSLGICLDPGNTVAALESPAEVIARCAPRTVNLHVKDFAFSRRDGWVGFTFAGVPLGEGLLDYDGMREAVDPAGRGITQVIEHWLPWQGDPETTVQLERQWTQHNLEYLRSKNS